MVRGWSFGRRVQDAVVRGWSFGRRVQDAVVRGWSFGRRVQDAVVRGWSFGRRVQDAVVRGWNRVWSCWLTGDETSNETAAWRSAGPDVRRRQGRLL